MGATKIAHYNSQIIKQATLANALGHPARLMILEALKDHKIIRPKDLEKVLQLSKCAVHAHIQKLVKAGVVELEFYPNEYHLQVSRKFNNAIEVFFSS